MNLLGNSYQSQLLKEMFVFYVIPMLNVEGVILGNSHANVSGQYVHLNYLGHQAYCPESNAVLKLLSQIDEPLFMALNLSQDNSAVNIHLDTSFSASDPPHTILNHLLFDKMLNR